MFNFLFNFYFCDVSSGVGLWLVKTYQYGCHPSVLSHHALGTVECDESYCNERGDHIWSELFLPWVILRRERHHDHIWISNFLWRQFRGVGLIPLYGIWAGSTHIWERLSALGFLGAYNVSHPTKNIAGCSQSNNW